MPVTSTRVVIGTKKCPDSGILLKYKDDDYSQGYSQMKEASRALTKNNILQPYINEDDYRSSKADDNIGYIIHCFDIRYQKNFHCGQSIEVEF